MDPAMIREKALGSFSFDVAKRMLAVLSEHGKSMKKTNLASRAGLNYNVCLRYVRILDILGWVEVNSEVTITEMGKGIFANLLAYSKTRASTTDCDVWPSNMAEKKNIKHCWSTYISSSSSSSTTTTTMIKEGQTVSESKQKTAMAKRKTIMIVDDEEDVAETYKYFLSTVGYDVRTFIDSRLALYEYMSDPFRYDLLILDIRMQNINGLQLYQGIKAINSACRAIFVSALDAGREIVSILPGTSPQDLMRKPVSKEQLISAVKRALVQ